MIKEKNEHEVLKINLCQKQQKKKGFEKFQGNSEKFLVTQRQFFTQRVATLFKKRNLALNS